MIQKNVTLGYKLVKGRFKKFIEIPKDWTWTKIGDECKLTSGSTPSREHPEFFDGKILWVNSSELDYNIIEDTEQHITQEAVKESNLKIHPPGTFLIAITGLEAVGTRGRCAILGQEATTNQSCMAFYPNKKLLAKFLFYYYQLFGESLIFQLAQGTKQQSLNVKLVKSIPFALSSIKEQQKIISILFHMDALIQEHQKIIEQSKVLKKGLMQSLLTKGLNNIQTESVQFIPKWNKGKIPKTWKVVKLSDVGKIITGSTPSTSNLEFYGSDYYWATPDDIQNDSKFVNDTNTKLTKKGFDNARGIHEKSILFVCIGSTIGKIVMAKTKMATNQQINSLVCRGHDPDFIYYQLLFNSKKIKSLGNTVAVPILNKTDYGKYKIAVPKDITEQQKIGSILSNVDSFIQNEMNLKENYEKIKKGLMQQLLTGQKRVKI